MDEQMRVAYGEHFITHDNMYEYNGGKYFDLSLYFIHKIFDKKTGEELFFTSDPGLKTTRCSYNKEKGYLISINENSLYNIEIEPRSCIIWEDSRTPTSISFYDGVELLQTNSKIFDNPDNKPVQCISYQLLAK